MPTIPRPSTPRRSRASVVASVVGAALAAGLLLGARPAGAQSTASTPAAADSTGAVAGYVVEFITDSVVRAVDGAEVIDLMTRRSVHTDAAGAFRFVGLPPGPRVVTVRRVGFQPFTTGVDVPVHETADLDIRLARRMATLDTVVVRGQRVAIEGPAAFRWRAQHGMGHYVTRTDLTRLHAQTARDAVIGMLGVRVDPQSGTPYFTRASYLASGGQRCGSAVVMLDGLPLSGGFDLRTLAADEIAGIEVYSSGATIPMELRSAGNGSCGLVAIWTR